MCQVDFISLTAGRAMIEVTEEGCIKTDVFSIAGYKGVIKDYGIGSIGIANSSSHSRSWYTKLSGEIADMRCGDVVAVANEMRDESRANGNGELGFKCTRIDVKVDVPMEYPLDAMKMKGEIGSAFADGRCSGRIPYMVAYSSDTDTLYIGAPSSAVRWRIYQKYGCWRYELQLRNGSQWNDAANAFIFLVDGGKPSEIFKAYAARYGDMFPRVDGDVLYEKARGEKEEHATITWLYGQVRKAIQKLSTDAATKWLEVIEEDIRGSKRL